MLAKLLEGVPPRLLDVHYEVNQRISAEIGRRRSGLSDLLSGKCEPKTQAGFGTGNRNLASIRSPSTICHELIWRDLAFVLDGEVGKPVLNLGGSVAVRVRATVESHLPEVRLAQIACGRIV